MKKYITEFRAYCNESKEIKTFTGKKIEANSFDEAKAYCKEFAPCLIVICEEIFISFDFSNHFMIYAILNKNDNGSVNLIIKNQLNSAIEREDYKEAARLRDLINQNDNNE